MIDSLRYLADEICSGVEIFYGGRTGGQSLKTAFILCDDYTELASKLFLLCDDPKWSDTREDGRFKSYHQVLDDVEVTVDGQDDANSATSVHQLVERMKNRRSRRNGFFHSAHLLELNVTERICLESFVDLFDLLPLLFRDDWPRAEAGARNLQTYSTLVRLDHKCLSDPQVGQQRTDLLARWPRNISTARTRGVQTTIHPDDLHLRLAILNGGTEFLDKVRHLLGV